MNAKDRKTIAGLLAKLEAIRDQVDEITPGIRELADAAQEKYDNMSEGLQQGEQGQAIEAAASSLSEAADACAERNVEDAISALEQLES